MSAATCLPVTPVTDVAPAAEICHSGKADPRCSTPGRAMPRGGKRGSSPGSRGQPYRLLGRVAAAGIAFLLMIVLSTASAAVSSREEVIKGEPKRIVILNATDPNLPAFLALDSAAREVINAGRMQPVELYAESLDMHRFPRERLEIELVSLLRKKYRNLKVDVVMAAAPIALEFAQRNLAAVWSGATIVFHSVPRTVLSERRLDPRTIGIPVQLEFRQTLDLALTLRPGTRRIAIVAGVAEPDKRHLELARNSLEGYTEKLDMEYLVGLPIAETIEAVRALPADSIVLYLTVFRDGAGAPLVPRDVLKRIAAVSPVPVFGVFETYLGAGIAAGSIVSYKEQGRLAGELVARVLNGEDPAAIGVQMPVAAGCIADWRQLRHWNVDTKLLPANCELRFREVTVWDEYHRPIMLTLAVILAQAALIVALTLQHRKLRQTQDALHGEYGRRSEAEVIAADLRSRLARFSKTRSLDTMATTIAHEISQPLIAIQNYAQAVGRRLLANTELDAKLIELVAKIEGQAGRAGAIIQRVRALVNHDEPTLHPVALGALLEEVIRTLGPESETRGCRIAYAPAADLPPVLADPLQIQLVLVNLLHNAMHSVCEKQGADRLITVDVLRLDACEVQVSVTDLGDGVAPERAADIFEPLYSGSRNGMGMGMGLAICHSILSAHGGRIWYDPNPASGAIIFRFTLRRSE